MPSQTEELRQIQNDLTALAARCEDEILEPLKALIHAAKEVGEAWSGSWIGHHALIYYAGISPPPPGQHFSSEWGPTKPTGVTGPTKISRGPQGTNAEFQQLVFPTQKEEIEDLVAHGFVRAIGGQSPLGFSVSSCLRNPQDDFDFSLTTSDGAKTLELTEIARLLGPEIKLCHTSIHSLIHSPKSSRLRRGTFLRNHRHGIAAMDFIVVPTVRFRLLYAWFVIGHGRREILHFGVTAHPTSPWVVQQLREAFPNDNSPRFLIYDNDSIFSERVTESIMNIGIEPRRTAFRGPWQNGIAERWVGSARREMLDHVIVMNERHLHRLLREYVDYYNEDRVHTQLGDSPIGRPTEHRPSSNAQIVGLPRVGGLHHRYEWQEAA